MNNFSTLDAQTPEGNLAHVASHEPRHGICEDAPACGCGCTDTQTHDREDDFADYNDNEVADYAHEGDDDSADSAYFEGDYDGGE